MSEIDDFDRRLLALLQVNARQTGQALAEQVGLSPAACLRRVQRLRETGVIEREVAIVAPEALGPSVTFLVTVEILRDGPDRIDRLKRRFTALPIVQRIYHVTGEADLVMVVAAPTMEDYTDFTERYLYAPEIRGFSTMVVLREYPGSG
ncbi:MAG: Lrp/AsnC family transcriptional regulator [Pseudomonadota bacterium]